MKETQRSKQETKREKKRDEIEETKKWQKYKVNELLITDDQRPYLFGFNQFTSWSRKGKMQLRGSRTISHKWPLHILNFFPLLSAES